MWRTLEEIAVRITRNGGVGFHNLQKCHGRVRKRGLLAVDQAQLPLHLELFDHHLHQVSGGELTFHAQTWGYGHTVAHRNEALHSVQGRQLYLNPQRSLVASKGIHHLCALGGGDVMGNEILRTQVADGDGLRGGQRMFWMDDEGESVPVDDDRADLRVFRAKGQDTELDGVRQDLIRDAAGQRAVHSDLDAWVLSAKDVQKRKQVEAGVFVRSEIQDAPVQGAQFFERAAGLRPEIEQFLRVFTEHFASVGQGTVAHGALKERFSEFCFEFGDGLADSWLGPAKAHGGSRKAAFLGDGEKGFELKE